MSAAIVVGRTTAHSDARTSQGDESDIVRYLGNNQDAPADVAITFLGVAPGGIQKSQTVTEIA